MEPEQISNTLEHIFALVPCLFFEWEGNYLQLSDDGYIIFTLSLVV